MSIAGFENDTATFEVETVTEEWDPIKEEYVETTEWSEEYTDVPVRAEQRDAEYVTDVHGDWPMEVYNLWVDPLDIGVVNNGAYELGVQANDRVELSGVTGRYSIQPPNLQRLDSQIPEHVELEVVKIGQ